MTDKTTSAQKPTLFVDRSGWRKGPWDDELDRYEWKDEATGLDCLIVRDVTLCGYVAVPPGHPMHRQSRDTPDVQVHGGLTYADACQGQVCHTPSPGEPDDVWWFGFDCGHCGDQVPDRNSLDRGTYRNVAYVKAEVARLAAQLKSGKNDNDYDNDD
ncbi:MAG: hypothetical protein H0U59_04100 [Gemmatimonadaceae bacterium]|nr:hypothetical protein [Gemmatimonadaceae bacterium]